MPKLLQDEGEKEDENLYGFTDEDEEEDEEDGISDTWEDKHGNDMEEGEIRSDEDEHMKEDSGNNGMCGDRPLVGDRRISDEQANGHCVSSINAIDSESRIEESVDEENHVDALHANEPTQPIGEHVQKPASRSKHNSSGPLGGLVSSGCFGPFTSPLAPIQNRIDPADPIFDAGGSLGKRRRLDKMTRKTQHMENAPSIDLNRCFNEQASISTVSGANSTSLEARKTVEVGKQLGFEIEVNDPILLEVLGEHGENQNPQ
ncbi:hypothetical protein L1887_18079 [Cichorium endivia]|nr:hypothetical protein L1887_18079 [Cichorium endivia]